MPESTLQRLRGHGARALTLDEALDDARGDARASWPRRASTSTAVTAKLLDDGVAAFASDFDKLVEAIGAKRKKIARRSDGRWSSLGTLADPVEERLSADGKTGVARRIWEQDATLWKPDPDRDRRTGWAGSTAAGADDGRARRAGRLRPAGGGRRLRARRAAGHGRLSLAPEVIAATFGAAAGHPRLHVLDTTDPDGRRAGSTPST